MHRNKSASFHQFSMVPRADIPRSAFRMQKTYKTTFDAGKIYPFFLEEILPGDKWNLSVTGFARLATPLFPVMDNLHLDAFFFFCPNRLVWDNWQKFMGEQTDPDDSIDYTIPQVQGTMDSRLSLADYFGLPTADSAYTGASGKTSYSALPFRMYNLIINEWFRDQNLTDSLPVDTDDGPDANYGFPAFRAKRHDYFTSCLPWPQKGDAVSLPLSGELINFSLGQYGAPVRTTTFGAGPVSGVQEPMYVLRASTGAAPTSGFAAGFSATGTFQATSAPAVTTVGGVYPSNLWADLSEVTAGTINALRTAFQVQKLLERDARGGTRYTEIVRSHFGVISPDARLQRPEYLGGGTCFININPIAQTSATSADGTDTPQGNLAAIGTSLLRTGFTQAFTEHGYIMGLLSARADVTYQQGMRRHWNRLTRYDFYFPVFAHLGEQAVLNREIAYTGGIGTFPNVDFTADNLVFGYQERWAEYRYLPNEITGIFRSSHPQSIDAWHYSQFFLSAPPFLNDDFIQDASYEQVARSLAVGAGANGQQFISDFFFDATVVRPIPMYSVPGMVDHF